MLNSGFVNYLKLHYGYVSTFSNVHTSKKQTYRKPPPIDWTQVSEYTK